MKKSYIPLLLCLAILTAFLSLTSDVYAETPTAAIHLARFHSITTLADVAAKGYITVDKEHVIDIGSTKGFMRFL